MYTTISASFTEDVLPMHCCDMVNAAHLVMSPSWMVQWRGKGKQVGQREPGGSMRCKGS